MQVSTVVSTRGFQQQDQEAQKCFVKKVVDLLGDSNCDFFVGDNTKDNVTFEDNNRTARLPYSGDSKVYAVLDGGGTSAAEWAEMGHAEYPILTFLLSEEY
jgi:hypothetical protein